MKVKIFNTYGNDKLEEEMNGWFSENPNIEVKKIDINTMDARETFFCVVVYDESYEVLSKSSKDTKKK